MSHKLATSSWCRHSLLARNPELSPKQFSSHYETHHGPLAASLNGFRKFAWRYLQNHVLELPDGSEPRFHGITMTSQVPRENYRVGFFNEPDYEKVKPDELYLFDVSRTVSVLGCEQHAEGGDTTSWKAVLFTQRAYLKDLQLSGMARRVINQLETASASALGFDGSQFEYELLVELWFETEDARNEAYRVVTSEKSILPNPFLLPVREVLIFGPEKPWNSTAATHSKLKS